MAGAGVCVYGFLPASAQVIVYLGLAATGGMAVVAGVAMNRPAYRLPWHLVAVGLAIYLAADLLYYGRQILLDRDEFPGPADALYLSSYPFLIAALLLLIRRRDRGRDLASLIDATTIAVAVALLDWVYLAEPRFGDTSTTGRLVIVCMLVADIVLLAVAARLIVAGGSHRPAFYLVCLGAAALLVTDFAYAWEAASQAFELGSALDAGWIGYYCLIGAAALHPSMRTLAEPTSTSRSSRFPRGRLLLISAVVLVAPAVALVESVHGHYEHMAAVAGGSVVLFLLVMARIWVLVQEQRETAARERTLREAAAAFVGATSRQSTYDAALAAVPGLVGSLAVATRLAVGTIDEMEIVDARGGEAQAALGGHVYPQLLSSPDGAAIGHGQSVPVHQLDPRIVDALRLADVSGELVTSPVLVSGVLRGVLMAVTERPVGPGATTGLETLAAQLALALESAALTEDLHSRQSEARFRAMVQHSSDAITLVSSDSRISYLSPSLERLSGYAPEEMLLRRLLDFVHPEDTEAARTFFREVTASPGTTASIELRLGRRDGSWLEVECVGNNLEADPHVGAVVITIRDIGERKQFERQLTHQAFHDALTGLANRALFTDRLTHSLARRTREPSPLAVVLLDLDDFKTVNDSLGHVAGDSLLIAIAGRLRALVRPSDTTARLGGDEFAILLDDLSGEDGALQAVERVIAGLHEPLLIEGKAVYVQASVGIAFAGDGPATPEELMRNADVAMYAAKKEGKGRYAVYEARMHAAALLRLELRANLQRALADDEFLLHYQPIVSLKTAQTVGLEALVRWRHPDRGLVGPMEFIGLAEETGLIVPLGGWIIAEACRQARVWDEQRGEADRMNVSVNLSQKQLESPELAVEVGNSLTGSGVDPALITLEITESAVMSDVRATVTTLQSLRQLGVRLAIDDFGTGYSSLSWLRQLPFDVLKIDKEFVDGVAQHEEDSLLVGAVIDLAHNLGLRTVAEGIEHPAQIERLRALRCDFGQGYHFARAMPARRVPGFLAAERGQSASLHPDDDT